MDDIEYHGDPEDVFVALAELLEVRPAWHRQAACSDHPEVNFFPGRGESTEPARAVCAECPVASACLEDALATADKFGIWGGLSERERRRIRRQRRHAA